MKNKNKLLYIHNADFSNLEGNKSQVLSMCEAFSQNNTRVDLLGFYNTENLEKDKRFESLKFKYNFLKSNLNYYLRSVLLFKEILKPRYKAFKSIFTRDLLVAYLISKFTNKKAIYELHHIINNKLWKIFLRKVFNKTEYLVVISKGLQEYLIKIGFDKNKIIVLEDGVNLEKFDIKISKKDARKKLKINTKRKIISYVGNTQEKRDLKTLAKATKNIKDLEVHVYGKNQKYIDEICEKQENFIFKGYTLIPEIVYKASDVLFAGFTSKIETVNYMSPLKVFEYMGSKVQIVISDFPRNRDILNDNEAFYYKSENVENLRIIIKMALINKERKEIKAFQKVKKYTWKKRAKKIMELY